MIFKFQEPKPNYLSTFVYTDNITNKKFTITDEFSFKSPSLKERMTHEESNNQLMSSSIKQCLKLMRSTRNFHLSTLKNRNYKSKVNVNQNTCSDTQTDIDIDKIHEQKLDRYFKSKEVSKQDYKKQKNQLSKKLKTSIGSFHSKNDDQQMKKQILSKENQNNLNFYNKQSNSVCSASKNFTKSKQKSVINKGSFKTLKDFILTKKQKNRNLEILDEDEIMKNINEQLKYKVRKNGQFLVTPNLSKRLMTENKENKNRYHPIDNEKANQLHNRNSRQSFLKFALQDQNSRASLKARQSTQGDFYQCSQIQSFKFKFEDHPQEMRKVRLTDTVAHKRRPCETKIIKSIQKGNFFQADIELSVDPSLLELKQTSNGNNLLHICVMNNRVDIFEMILKKSRELHIDLLSEKNKVIIGQYSMEGLLYSLDIFYHFLQTINQIVQQIPQTNKKILNFISKK